MAEREEQIQPEEPLGESKEGLDPAAEVRAHREVRLVERLVLEAHACHAERSDVRARVVHSLSEAHPPSGVAERGARRLAVDVPLHPPSIPVPANATKGPPPRQPLPLMPPSHNEKPDLKSEPLR